MDVPNERSSHSVPVPRGSGLVIAAVCLSGFLAAYIISGEYPYLVFLCGGAAISLIGWLDDLYSMPRTARLLVQTIAALYVIYSLGFFDYVSIGSHDLFLGLPGIVFTLIWFIWVINAFNFMDGIDGIAGTQALIAALAWGAFGFMTGSQGIILISVMVAGASAAFLYHNWQPAKVFMGDVGSTFLGFIFAVLPLFALYESRLPRGFVPLFAAAVLWPFVFDTVFTFIRRLLTVKSEVFNPHRTHIYQLLVATGRPHQKVTIIYGFITFVLALAAVIIIALDIKVAILIPGLLFAASVVLIYGFFISAKRPEVRNHDA